MVYKYISPETQDTYDLLTTGQVQVTYLPFGVVFSMQIDPLTNIENNNESNNHRKQLVYLFRFEVVF